MVARLAVSLALCAPAAAGADWYRWSDASGTVHVTNQLASPPPAAAVERFHRAPEATPPAAADAGDAIAAGGATAREPGAVMHDGRATRLAGHRAHLALLRASGRSDAAALALENQLEDAIRIDEEALR